MHFVGLLVLAFIPCCISRAFNDDLEKTVNGLKGIEPLHDAANSATEPPPVNGAGDEGKIGDSSEATEPPPVNGAGDEGTRGARDSSRPEREVESRDTLVNVQVNGVGYGTNEAVNLGKDMTNKQYNQQRCTK
ncbi:hypothetical protein ACROYT_G020596 [Oculina patagonica]